MAPAAAPARCCRQRDRHVLQPGRTHLHRHAADLPGHRALHGPTTRPPVTEIAPSTSPIPQARDLFAEADLELEPPRAVVAGRQVVERRGEGGRSSERGRGHGFRIRVPLVRREPGAEAVGRPGAQPGHGVRRRVGGKRRLRAPSPIRLLPLHANRAYGYPTGLFGQRPRQVDRSPRCSHRHHFGGGFRFVIPDGPGRRRIAQRGPRRTRQRHREGLVRLEILVVNHLHIHALRAPAVRRKGQRPRLRLEVRPARGRPTRRGILHRHLVTARRRQRHIEPHPRFVLVSPRIGYAHCRRAL